MAQRGQLKGLCNKSKFTTVQREIGDVSKLLKESNKNLCRSLKENPDVKGNALKLNEERAQVHKWLEGTKSGLVDMSFAELSAKVEAERKDQERLFDVKKKEKEASHAVQQLDAELQREHDSNDKETKMANQQIKELKEQLQKDKIISEIEYKFEEKKLRAQEQALLRTHAQIERRLEEELAELKASQGMETSVHESAHAFLTERMDSLGKQRDQWQDEYHREVSTREGDLKDLIERRQAGRLQLVSLQEKRTTEAKAHEAKENDMRNAVLIEKQRREQLQRMAEAVLFLQDEGRRYIERINARLSAKKGKKKKGKKNK